MFSAALHVVRPAASVARSSLKSPFGLRAISTTASRLSGPAAPSLYGPGSKGGEVPSDETQATGLERLQLLGQQEGVEVFDTNPLDSSRVGTLADPIKVYSLDTERVVGCTGSPADSHELHWFAVKQNKNRRCPECGSVYALDYQGSPEHNAHHH